MSSKATPSSLVVCDIPIHFDDDWNVGIGGGLWSTGLALARYFDTPHAAKALRTCLLHNKPLRILELGSGNGVLGMCLAACATTHNISIGTLVLTDFADHVPLMQATVSANPQALQGVDTVVVKEYIWGSPTINDEEGYDLIIGSDVAYGSQSYDPLIDSLRSLSLKNQNEQQQSSSTVALIGFTMMDTRPEFFDRLTEQGFVYRKLSDHLLEREFRGTTFGVFVIQQM